MVWEMTTHQSPYQGIPPLSVAFGVGSGTLRLNTPSRAPPALQRIMTACLAYDQHQRPSFHRIVLQLEDGLDAERRGATEAGPTGGSGSDLGSDSSQSSMASWSTDSHTSARDFFSAQVRMQGGAAGAGHVFRDRPSPRSPRSGDDRSAGSGGSSGGRSSDSTGGADNLDDDDDDVATPRPADDVTLTNPGGIAPRRP